MSRTRVPCLANEPIRDRKDMNLAELALRVRTLNMLEGRGILTVRDLLSRDRNDLLAISNFGQKGFAEVLRALKMIGFTSELNGNGKSHLNGVELNGGRINFKEDEKSFQAR